MNITRLHRIFGHAAMRNKKNVKQYTFFSILFNVYNKLNSQREIFNLNLNQQKTEEFLTRTIDTSESILYLFHLCFIEFFNAHLFHLQLWYLLKLYNVVYSWQIYFSHCGDVNLDLKFGRNLDYCRNTNVLLA